MSSTTDPNIMKRRATTVEFKSCGCLLRKIYMDGDDVIGEIETLSGFLGPDVAKLILFDKINLGFSLRALGSVNTKSDGTIEVLQPIKPITYDIVSNPSHIKARVLEFLPESFNYNDYNDDSTIVCESSGDDILLLQQDGVNINSLHINNNKFNQSIYEDIFKSSIKRIKFHF